MKVKIDGHTVVVNKMSIYIDGLMEFQAVNMITKLFGEETAKRVIVQHMYGVN